MSYFFFYQVINDYFKLLKDDETADTEDIVYLSCNFFTGSSRSKNDQITESLVTIKTKFIIIPYNLNYNHWCLIIVDVAETSLLYFDSIRNRPRKFFNKVNSWLLNISVLPKKFQIIDMSQKNDLFPSQGDNKTECGVFVMMFADYFINGLMLDFNLRDMITFRKKIFLSLCSKNLNYSTNFYPACSLVKNNYLIRFQSLLSKPHNTVTSSICRVLIDNFIIFDREYVILSDVIKPIADIKKFILKFDGYEPINFDTKLLTRQQSTRILLDPNSCIVEETLKILFDSLAMFFTVISSEQSSPPDKFELVYKLLKSLPNCPKQELHHDSKQRSDSSYNIQYSLIVAIESNTKLILSDHNNIDIPINGMIMFRGDYMHAGASYPKINHRIFASCSNKPLEKKNVFVAQSKCN